MTLKEQKKSKIAVFPGTFDPFTNGHRDIVTRSLGFFDRIYIAVVGDNLKTQNSTRSNLNKNNLVINNYNLVNNKNNLVINNITTKTPLFSLSERINLIKDEFIGVRQIKVESFDGLLVDFVLSKGANLVVRGIRATTDYEYEAQMALMNRHLSDNQVETFFLMSSEECSYISSSVVKQVAKLNGDVSKLVGKNINKALKLKFKN